MRTLRYREGTRGFTLVELLVVLALVVALSAGIGLALGGLDAGRRVRACEAEAAGLFQLARSQAVLQQTRTRVIVLDDAAYPERHLREAGVVYEDPALPGKWRSAGSAARFPDGIYFWSERSVSDGRFRVKISKRDGQQAGTGPRWRYYEFDVRGRLAASQGRTFVVGASFWEEVSGEAPEFDKNTPLGGFVIFPLGGVVIPENSEELR